MSATLVDRSYQLHEQLGEGGMGTVFRAVHLLNNQVVALKLVTPQFAADKNDASTSDDEANIELRLALAREFQTLASLHHPNVIRVQSYGFDDHQGSYFTMELLEQAATILRFEPAPEPVDKVLLVAQLLRALAYIHRRGVIHRDIKPGNVLVVRGEVKLLDFGIAAEQFSQDPLAGTLQYMAPELLTGASPSVVTDLYAVGLILHQMLTGTLPSADGDSKSSFPAFGADHALRSAQPLATSTLSVPGDKSTGKDMFPTSLTAALGRLALLEPGSAEGPEAVISVAGPLGDVLRKLLHRNPELRYQSADAVLLDLAAALAIDIPIETAETRESFLRATVLVGRDVELTVLRERLSDCQDGQGCTLLLGGESGVGKSRLLAELRTLALVHGFWTAEGQSVTEGGTYYQEWQPLFRALCLRVGFTDAEAAILKPMIPEIVDLLGRPVPDPPVVKPEEVQTRLAATLRTLLRKLERPLLIILEDLHWGRNETITLLNALNQSIADFPVFIVGTYRSDEGPELPGRLPAMQVLHLKRLGHDQIAQLSASMLGEVGKQKELVHYLERQTEGNVFFLIEIVRALAEDVGGLQLIGQGTLPESLLTTGIERIIEQRVERVDPAYRPVLAFAATLGRNLDRKVMEQAFPEVNLRSLLLQCANAAVLESQGADWRFAHDKLRETILRHIPLGSARALHMQVARALEDAYVGAERTTKSALLAHHYGQAGAHYKALGYLISAGDSAAALYLLGEARVHYAAARATFPHLTETAELRRRLVDVLLRQVQSGLLSDANEVQLQRLTHAREVLEGLVRGGDADREDRLRTARVDYYCGRVYHYSGQPSVAIQYYQRVLPIAREFNDQELLTTPSYVIGLALCLQGQFGRARTLLAQAMEPLLRLMGPGVDSIRCVTYYCIALSGSGHFEEALRELPRAQAWAEQANQPVHLATYHVLAGVSYLLAADWPRTIRTYEKSYELAIQTNEKLYAYSALDFIAWAHSHLGLHEEALAGRMQAREIRNAVGGGILRDWFEAAEAEIYLNAGRTNEALGKAQAVAQASKSAGQPYSHAVAERLIGRARAELGAPPAEYEPHFQISLDLCREHEQVSNAAQTELAWALWCQRRGDVTAAATRAAHAIATLRAGGYTYALAEAHRKLTEAGVPISRSGDASTESAETSPETPTRLLP